MKTLISMILLLTPTFSQADECTDSFKPGYICETTTNNRVLLRLQEKVIDESIVDCQVTTVEVFENMKQCTDKISQLGR